MEGDKLICAKSFKIIYKRKTDAIWAAKLMKYRKRLESGCHFNVYRCKLCKGWHVGTEINNLKSTANKNC